LLCPSRRPVLHVVVKLAVWPGHLDSHFVYTPELSAAITGFCSCAAGDSLQACSLRERQPRWGNVGKSLGYLPYSPVMNILTMLLVLQRSQVLGDALIYWLNLVAKPVGS
jgi:hypothetical protein